MAKKQEQHQVNTPEVHPGLITREELPDYLQGKDGFGSENVKLRNLTVPRLQIIQALSPQVDEANAAYIHGAKVGDIFNTLTKDLYGTTIYFVDAFFREEWMVAVPQNEGGGGGRGFRGIYTESVEAKDHLQRNPKNEKLEIVELGVHYGLLLDEDRKIITMIAFPMKSSQLKVSRQLVGFQKQKGGPIWAAVWRFDSISETNQAGKPYKNYKLTPVAGFTPKAVAEAAEKLWKDVAGSKLTMDTADLTSEEDTSTTEERF